MLPDRSLVPETSTLLPLQLNSSDSQTQLSDAAEPAIVMEEGQWTYQVSAKLSARFDLRAWPAPKASKTGSFVHQGDVLSVDARLVIDGILFLHVAPDLAQQTDCRAQTESVKENRCDRKGATRTQSAVCGGWIFDRTQGGGNGICSAPGDRVLLSELPGGKVHKTKLVGGRETSHCCADPVAVARSAPIIPSAVSCLLRLAATSLQTQI